MQRRFAPTGAFVGPHIEKLRAIGVTANRRMAHPGLPKAGVMAQ